MLVKNGKSTSYNKRQRGDVEVDDDSGEHRKHEQEGLFGGGGGELTISIIPETKFYPAIIVINSEKSLDSSA